MGAVIYMNKSGTTKGQFRIKFREIWRGEGKYTVRFERYDYCV